MSSVLNNWILYDGECPFCRSYVGIVRLQEVIGPVRILNARNGGPEVDMALAAGLDLDEGMVLQYQGQLYHGDACIHLLATLSETGGILRALLAWVFRSPSRARLLYPWLRGGRNMTLKLLGKHKIGKF
jgi:predicted DCC family thiol-disulfide oxidoreductase YuxK